MNWTGLRFIGVEKRFPGFSLGPIDLEIPAGSAVGLVGPNGAGKTTALRCLLGLLRPDAGSVEIDGASAGPSDDPSWKRRVGYIGADRAFFEQWTGRRNLEFLSAFYPGWDWSRTDTLAARFAVPLDRPVYTLSGGERARLAIVSTLSHAPRLIVLDEPTAGLDPVVRADFLDTLWEDQADGERTIIYSTHILSDIERLAGELVFVDRGQLLYRTGTDELQEKWAQIYFRLEGEPGETGPAFGHRRDGDQHRLTTPDRAETVRALEAIGARDIRCFAMAVDEIAVAILRRARPRGELVA